MTSRIDYPFATRPLSEDEGGGILIEFPDLPGCMSDGDTIEEAMDNGKQAVESWIAACVANGDAVPEPGGYLSADQPSGKILQRIPKSVHRQLQMRAKGEGVSVNALVLSYISQGLGMENNAPNRLA